ncbi:ribosome small subunit-dependent GTPase A, partial [Christensenellaceae bacterium OttesenSCG-928-K19]|nr:ribosome small subunit-dependent GTPase A [Christensenellaceae bacterium OttesenSCG-928-K19]
GKFVCFTGQSAVGKSSLINAISEDIVLEVGGMSKKTARGKHTTRTTELLYLPQMKAYVFDTPGFSMFDMKGIGKEELGSYYGEFVRYAGECRFRACVHDKEPDCAVKDAVEKGMIDESRYHRYLKLLNSINEEEDYG